MLSCSFQVEGGMLTLDCTGNKQCQCLICKSQKMTEDPSDLACWTTKSNRPRKVTKWTAGAHYLGIWTLTFLYKTEFKIKATTTKTFSLTGCAERGEIYFFNLLSHHQPVYFSLFLTLYFTAAKTFLQLKPTTLDTLIKAQGRSLQRLQVPKRANLKLRPSRRSRFLTQ